MVFLYLIKNYLITLIGILFCFLIILINNYLKLIIINNNDILLTNYFEIYINIIITLFIISVIYYICSLINYLITDKRFKNYYSFIIALIIGSLHSYCVFQYNLLFNIISYIYIISLHIFLSFFINYSTKYK